MERRSLSGEEQLLVGLSAGRAGGGGRSGLGGVEMEEMEKQEKYNGSALAAVGRKQ